MIKKSFKLGKILKITAVILAASMTLPLCACNEDTVSVSEREKRQKKDDKPDTDSSVSDDNTLSSTETEKDPGDYHSLTGKDLLGVNDKLTSEMLYGEVPCKNGRILRVCDIAGAGPDSGAYTVWGNNNIIVVDGEDTFFVDDFERALCMGEIPEIAKGDYDGDGSLEAFAVTGKDTEVRLAPPKPLHHHRAGVRKVQPRTVQETVQHREQHQIPPRIGAESFEVYV